MPSIADLLSEGRRRLAAAAFSPQPREASLLLCRVLGWSEARVMAYPESEVDPAAASRFRELLTRRVRGEPAAYVLGEREFYGRSFRVDNRVLIPRPESELLVEIALALDLPPAPRILDVGTGSGCLAVTLALELRAARMTAVDLSPAALAVAAENARRLGASVHFAAADLASSLQLDSFDLVVSNPPYIAPEEASEISREVVDHEPAAALFSPAGGLSTISRLLNELAGLPGGVWLAMEIGHRQANDVARLAASSPFELLEIRPDLAGIPRVALLERSTTS